MLVVVRPFADPELPPIVYSCVPSTEPVFAVEDLKPNVHITAIGSYQPTMREVSSSTPSLLLISR